MWSRYGLRRDDAHRVIGVRTLDRELHLARDARVERVIASHADIYAGVHARAALAHQDLSCVYLLAAIGLDPEALRFRIAAVTRAAACFLVCHGPLPSL